MKTSCLFVLMFSMLAGKSLAQQVSLTGKVINSDDKPINEVLVYLGSNPALNCYSDSLGNFSLTYQVNTSVVTENKQNEIMSFENQKLLLFANNQSVSVDVITLVGIPIMNILNLNRSTGTIGLYPEAYISDLPKAIYIVRARVGGTLRSYKIQNIIASGYTQGIEHYSTNNTLDNSFAKPMPMLKSGVSDTMVLVHDFYKSRIIPINSYTVQFDTIHLNNFADYTVAEGFEPSVTYLFNGYANFTNIFSADSAQFIIDYDTLLVLKGDLKIIAIPVDKISNLDTSITFISGLHFEPSGTKFLQSVQITVLMKGPIPENLVVFQYTDQGETYFIPYVTHVMYDDYCIVFNINHFSSIGIGTGNVPSTNPEGFTSSDQFISYLAQYVGNFGEVPAEIFTLWFNNVVVPMINKIMTYEDLCAALAEFGNIGKNFILSGGNSINDLPCYFAAMEMFCSKMTKIWNDCVEEYNRLDDNCLKREILKIALNILALNQLNGDICSDFSQSDLNDFGNGEFYHLANNIEFLKQVKHLEAAETYVVEYILKSISGNPLPEVVLWTSSNPSVASINADGTVMANSDGETIITGKICDIENTIKVVVGDVNCEKQYCFNEFDNCYPRYYRYKCTGVTRFFKTEPKLDCGSMTTERICRYTIVDQLNDHYGKPYEFIWSVDKKNYLYDHETDNCLDDYFIENGVYKGYFFCSEPGIFFYAFDWINYVRHTGYLKVEDLMILDVRYNAGDAGYKNTKFFCPCIDN